MNLSIAGNYSTLYLHSSNNNYKKNNLKTLGFSGQELLTAEAFQKSTTKNSSKYIYFGERKSTKKEWDTLAKEHLQVAQEISEKHSAIAQYHMQQAAEMVLKGELLDLKSKSLDKIEFTDQESKAFYGHQLEPIAKKTTAWKLCSSKLKRLLKDLSTEYLGGRYPTYDEFDKLQKNYTSEETNNRLNGIMNFIRIVNPTLLN